MPPAISTVSKAVLGANAIDIAGFVLVDGTRIAVVNDWQGEGDKARFLRAVRDGACRAFGTVLSPEYNEAHRDHFHLDQAARGLGGVCRGFSGHEPEPANCASHHTQPHIISGMIGYDLVHA